MMQRRDLFVQKVICKGTSAVRCGNCHEGRDADRKRLEVG
jgi:hypothetical protein